MNRRFLAIIGFLALLIYFMVFQSDTTLLKIVSEHETYKLQVEIVRTDEEKELGLMGRESLADDEGMLFVYGENRKPIIWMKNMLIPIDIIFIGEDLKISFIQKSVEPCTAEFDRQCHRYSSTRPSTYVLEVPAGYAERNDIVEGDKIILPSDVEGL
jgi:uncharacterized membrane protein (UPF0127 family)